VFGRAAQVLGWDAPEGFPDGCEASVSVGHGTP